MYKNILLALHGDEINLEAVIEKTISLAENGSEITLLTVKELNLIHYGEVDTLLTFTAKEQFIDYINETADKLVEKTRNKLKEMLNDKKLTFNCREKKGKPADEIIKELKENNYDLLVLGTKAPGPGNTSSKVKERIAKEHPCTVLMIK